jgi:mycothiol synthase
VKAEVRPVTPRDEALVAASLGANPERVLGGTLAADLHDPAPDSAAWVADDGYARIARGPDPSRWMVALADGDTSARAALLGAATAHVAARGGGIITWWSAGASAADDFVAAAAGYAVAREQHQLRVPLPPTEEPRFASGITVRDLDLARDVDAWLAVNNAAFAGHAEQGGWTRDVLLARTEEPWFDPTLFVMAFDDAGLAGFNWLKVHGEEAPPLGEIYVIAVAPGRQGRGLGRALALAGLHRLAARGITIGMLYVAADNEPALRLYRDLGFTTYRTDRAYEREVSAS